jgi:AcrR family transcriptional regulator
MAQKWCVAKPKKVLAKPVWSRPEPGQRPAPAPLSRDKIVAAAIAIADEQGLEAVSLRNVAARLNAGPMRLYTYTSTKEGLLELMIDAIYAEMAELGPLRGDWCAVLRAYAKRLRAISTKHRWFVSLLGGRPHPGPHALAAYERLMAALQRTVPRLEDALAAARVVIAWAVGALHIEANDFAAERATGQDERAWQEATWPWLQEQLSTGEFPISSRIVHEVKHESPEEIFEHGLECVLDGLGARLPRPARK